MSNKRLFSVLLPLLCGGLFYLTAQSDLSGVWQLRTSNNDGTYRTLVLKLSQSGDSLSGSVINNYRPSPISEGSIKDGKFHFVVGTGERQRSFDGSVEGDHLNLQVKSSTGKVLDEGSAQKTTEQAVAPPAPLPVPELHDVRYNGLAKTPPMGWNSWNHFHRNIDDKTVREIADGMVSSGMKAAGYIYVNIDDTWQGERDSAGKIHPNTKFPDMKALADYVHSKGSENRYLLVTGPHDMRGLRGKFRP